MVIWVGMLTLEYSLSKGHGTLFDLGPLAPGMALSLRYEYEPVCDHGVAPYRWVQMSTDSAKGVLFVRLFVFQLTQFAK